MRAQHIDIKECIQGLKNQIRTYHPANDMFPVKTGKISRHKHKKRHMEGIDCQIEKLTPCCQLQKMTENHQKNHYCFDIIKFVKSLCHITSLTSSSVLSEYILYHLIANIFFSFLHMCLWINRNILYPAKIAKHLAITSKQHPTNGFPVHRSVTIYQGIAFISMEWIQKSINDLLPILLRNTLPRLLYLLNKSNI